MSLQPIGTEVMSSWRDKINAIVDGIQGSVIRKSTDGAITSYLPAADTDVARGDALVLAFSELSTGDTVIVHSGSYDLGNSGLISGVDMNMAGVGNPTIYTTSPVGTGNSGFNFGTGNRVSLFGLTFRTNCTDADYGAGKAQGDIYNLRTNNVSEVLNCNMVLNSELTTIDSGTEPKNVVDINGNASRFTNCNLLTIGTPAVLAMHGAFHGNVVPATSQYGSFDGCNMLGQNVYNGLFESAPQLTNCKANTPNPLNLGMMNLYEARSIGMPIASDIFVDSFYREYSRTTSENCYQFSACVASGSSKHTLAEVTDAPLSGAQNRNYEIEIFAQYFRVGSNDKFLYYYHGIVDGGTEYEIAKVDTLLEVGGADSQVQFEVSAAGSPDVLSFQARVGDVTPVDEQSVNGWVKFYPMKPGDTYPTNVPYGSYQHSKQIEFFDLAVV